MENQTILYQVTHNKDNIVQKIEQKVKVRHLTKRAENKNILFLRK